MKLPPIDLSKLIHLLKAEGRTEIAVAKARPNAVKAGTGVLSNPFHPIFFEWDNIISILERDVIPMLSKGCDTKALVVPAQKLAKSAGAISLMASQILGFVPGPVGIVCSIVNAIACFSTGNIVGGLFELLGCIPGGKVAGKASSKLFPKIKEIMIEIVQSNHSLKAIVEVSSKQSKIVTEKYAPKTKKVDVGQGYGVRTPAQSRPSVLEQSKSPHSAVEAQREIGKYIIYSNTYVMPKTNLWPNLR